MDLYTTIVGLYSQNRHEVLRVVNTAIHSKCTPSEGIEVIHTGFYCFTHTGKELEFLYDTQSQIRGEKRCVSKFGRSENI